MLEMTLATEFIPSTNVRGEVPGANWSFLLPSFELDRVICFGVPTVATLTTLAHISARIVVMCMDPMSIHVVKKIIQQHDLHNIYPILVNHNAPLPIPNGGVDLLLIPRQRDVHWLTKHRTQLKELQCLLKEDGLTYFEVVERRDLLLNDEALHQCRDIFGSLQHFWLTPLSGEMHTAVPVHDHETIEYFLRHNLYSPSINLDRLEQAMRSWLTQPWFNRLARQYKDTRRQLNSDSTVQSALLDSNVQEIAIDLHHSSLQLRKNERHTVKEVSIFLYSQLRAVFDHTERWLSKLRLLNRFRQRYGILVGHAVGGLDDQPPQYLRLIAKHAGVNIDQHRWGLAARGEYTSRKVLVFLFKGVSKSPEYIVKMTRVQRLNYRLENEYYALSLLQEKGIGKTLPTAVFFGHHNNLAIIGETVIDGVPFERRSRATLDCPYARAVIDWFCEFGAASADATAVTPLQVAENLETLFHRFMEIYQLTPAHRDFLVGQIASIARSKEPFPLVFQHGDPGTWNIMVTQAGDPVLLDWEAAEPQGMPLWDLFYFLRHYQTLTAKARGVHKLSKLFQKPLSIDSPLTELGVEASRRYCEHVGLSVDMVEPLFYTCWMHRALKESTRLASDELEHGQYVSLLRRCIDQRNTPTLQRLFSLNTLA